VNLKPEVFSDQRTRILYQSLIFLLDNNRTVNSLLLFDFLKSKNLNSKVSSEFIEECIENRFKTQKEYQESIDTLIKYYSSRELLTHFSKFEKEIVDGVDPQEVLHKNDKLLNELNLIKSDISVISTGIDAFEERVKILKRRDEIEPIMSGFRNLDELLSEGFPKKYISVIAGRPGMAKAQPLYSKILTPNGWTTMGEINVGDKIIGGDGKIKKVLAIHPQNKKEIFEITLSTGLKTRCTLDHLWLTRSHKKRKSWKQKRHNEGIGKTPTVKPLKEILETLKVNNVYPRFSHSIDQVKPIEFEKRNLLIHPYILGVLLGNSCLSGNTIGFTTKDIDIGKRVYLLLPVEDELKEEKRKNNTSHFNFYGKTKKGEKKRKTKVDKLLQDLGLRGRHNWDKFIPEDYILSSIEDRLELLRGLIDIDGCIHIKGTEKNLRGSDCYINFETVSKLLLDDIVFLVKSLGGSVIIHKPRIPTYISKGVKKKGRVSYRINFKLSEDLIPVFCKRKKSLFLKYNHKNPQPWYIKNIKSVGEQECKCITVEDDLYVTDDFIVTHNSTFRKNLTVNLCNRGYKVCEVNTEHSLETEQDRTDSCLTNIPFKEIVRSKEWSNTDGRIKKIHDANVYINKYWNHHYIVSRTLTTTDLKYKLRYIKRRFGLDIVFIDLFDKLADVNVVKDKPTTVGTKLGILSQIAEELNIHICLVVQIQRRAEARRNKRPTLVDLKDSGAFEEVARLVMLLYRESYYDSTILEDICEVNIAKQNSGRAGFGVIAEFEFIGETFTMKPVYREQPKIFEE